MIVKSMLGLMPEYKSVHTMLNSSKHDNITLQYMLYKMDLNCLLTVKEVLVIIGKERLTFIYDWI